MNSQTKTKKCSVVSCRTCPYFEECDFFVSNSTGERFCPILRNNHNLNCKTENVVYLIFCKICNFQYIGETKNRLQTRFSGHRNSIKSGKSGQLIHGHFQDDCHGIGNCRILPIEQIDRSMVNSEGLNEQEIVRALTRIRLEKEKSWMVRLQTAYPFGLNSRVKGVGDFLPAQGTYQNFGGRGRRKNKRHSRRKPKRLRTKQIVDLDFIIQKHRTLNNTAGYLHYFKTLLYGIPRVALVNIVEKINDRDMDQTLRDVIISISHQRLFKPVQTNHKVERDFYHLDFRDKGMDFINLGAIFRNHNVMNKIPVYFTNKIPPIIGYRFNKSIAGKLFNYKQTLDEESIQEYDNGNLDCDCQDSRFKDRDHGHVITGDLEIVGDDHLREIIKKGPKYRLPRAINWAEDRRIIVDFLGDFMKKWVNKERKVSPNGIELKSLDAWFKQILFLVDRKIETGKNKFGRSWNLNFGGKMQEELDRLKNKYVITVTDKAQNNILFTCRKFYIKRAKEELIGQNQLTYREDHKSKEDINKDIIQFSNTKGIKVPNEHKDIPIIYWIPKMHKDPVGGRFIAGSKVCTIKLLSKYFSKALKRILYHMKLYSNTVFDRTGFNYYWIIENSLEFMGKIKDKNVTHMETYDFSTLYTALPHAEIRKKFSGIFHKVFKREGKRFLNVNMFRTFFSNTQYKNCCTFEVTDLLEILDFILDNIYVKFGDRIFKQVIGIPIGLDSGQDIANLLLFCYESEYVENISKNDFNLTRKFSLCSRYIDDLFVGNFPEFKDHIAQMYPRDLEIKLESRDPRQIAYLDLKIKSLATGLDFSVYDKRDDFSFQIVNFPFTDSCIPKKSFLGVFYSQLIRYARLSTKKDSFMVRAQFLVNKLKNQGYLSRDLRRLSLRFFKEKQELLLGYDINSGNDFLNELTLA